MKILAIAACAALITAPLGAGYDGTGDIFRRGDANLDGIVDSSDPIYLSKYLFESGPEPGCLNQADVNDDGSVNISDVSYLTNFLYQGGAAPPAPGPYATECSIDGEPRPGCEEDPCPSGS